MKRTTEDREADRYQRYALSFQQACMSNTKWRKVLTAIAESEISLVRTEYKLIESDHVFSIARGIKEIDITSRAFSDGAFQPFEYKWIQWMRFARRVQPKQGVGLYIDQDIVKLRDVIAEKVEAEMELDDQYLWIYGYRNRV